MKKSIGNPKKIQACLADPDRPLRRGRKKCYPWFDRLAAAQQRPRVLGATKLGRRRRVCFERVTVSAEDTVANARRFQCPVSERQTGSGLIWAGPAWSLWCKIPPQPTFFSKMLWVLAGYCSAPRWTARRIVVFPVSQNVPLSVFSRVFRSWCTSLTKFGQIWCN